MTDYSKMSDFEINLKVAHIILGSGSYDWNNDVKEVYLAGIDGGEFLPNGYFNPCNNPADAWPIISQNRISIMFDGTSPEYEGEYNEWCDAISSCQRFGVQHQSNPLRAAMVVFLMMKGAEKC
ncbi:DUF2591 family protein [Serratia marcescens]|uniref:phage protein NinX family protein n=1 Tax=Serratia marcescens TaxID=615 RepID=UPI001FD2A914|nr:phage protein NinX family protein [Serratia marcescens]UOO26826.1 DUF2591 family protein [Serratia marcescens]HBB9120197.1 DUF2591 family protein [Serratia marcescens]